MKGVSHKFSVVRHLGFVGPHYKFLKSAILRTFEQQKQKNYEKDKLNDSGLNDGLTIFNFCQ